MTSKFKLVETGPYTVIDIAAAIIAVIIGVLILLTGMAPEDKVAILLVMLVLIVRLDSKISIGLALGSIVAIPILGEVGMGQHAKSVTVYAFYLLCAGIIGMFLESQDDRQYNNLARKHHKPVVNIQQPTAPPKAETARQPVPAAIKPRGAMQMPAVMRPRADQAPKLAAPAKIAVPPIVARQVPPAPLQHTALKPVVPARQTPVQPAAPKLVVHKPTALKPAASPDALKPVIAPAIAPVVPVAPAAARPAIRPVPAKPPVQVDAVKPIAKKPAFPTARSKPTAKLKYKTVRKAAAKPSSDLHPVYANLKSRPRAKSSVVSS